MDAAAGRVDTCPACRAEGLETIYEVRGIPAHSCLLMDSRDEALGYPTGDLSLGWCPRCDFATNRLFDARKNAYSASYEEVQTFSPTFNAFATSLVERLVEKHDVRGKDVVEIGCGKGEFLMELCARGGNRGVGIDPSWLPGRGRFDVGDRVRFLPELYSEERHASLPADVIVCRHTLEHVQPVRDFVEMLRRAIGDRLDTLVFFELPDQERVFEECAFWDVYYEHCSYFTGGALARLFLSSGFEVTDLWKGFGDQYLLLEARPLAGGAAPRYRVDDDAEAARGRALRFSRETARVMEGWRARFRADAAAGRTVVVWGAGSKGVSFLTSLGLCDEIAALVDINPRKQGCFLPGTGHEVVSPESLAALRPDVVVLMNAIYRDEVARTLAELGLRPELVAV